MTTDCDKLTANQMTLIGWEEHHKNILLSPEPSCPNPQFVTKSLRQNY